MIYSRTCKWRGNLRLHCKDNQPISVDYAQLKVEGLELATKSQSVSRVV